MYVWKSGFFLLLPLLSFSANFDVTNFISLFIPQTCHVYFSYAPRRTSVSASASQGFLGSRKLGGLVKGALAPRSEGPGFGTWASSLMIHVAPFPEHRLAASYFLREMRV